MKTEPNDSGGGGGGPASTAVAVPAGVMAGPGTGGRPSGATPNNRLIRSFTLFDNRDFLPRTFQIELYEACKFRDTIVFLRPGNGKHFITVMLVKYFSPKSSCLPVGSAAAAAVHFIASRKVFFLTKMVNSIRLYASVFRAHTDFRVMEHHEVDPHLGNSLPWTYEEWQRSFVANDIHLMLDVTFERLLHKGFVGAENIQLLILDDVHKIILESYNLDENDESTGSHPDPKDECYTRIMRSLRAKGLQRNSTKYRVLGLSASILIENVSSKVFESMIGRIEQQLDCTCETYADLRMINKYSVPCRINLRYFPSIFVNNLQAIGVDQSKLKLSLFKIRNYTMQFYSFIKNLQDTKLSDQVYLVTHESLATAITDVLYVMGTLGEWCAIKLVDLYNREIVDTMSLLKGTKSNYLKLLSSTYTTLLLVKRSVLAYLPSSISEKLEISTPVSDATTPTTNTPATPKLTLAEFFSLSSPKLHLLAQILQDYLKELRGSSPIQSTFSFPANICAIIYAERRATVRIIAAWIAELVALTAEIAPSHPFTYLLPDYVFLKDEDRASGASSIYTQKQQQKSLHEIFYYRRQEEVLKRFRFAHNCNLLVTSSMSAEGLDVNRCNLVLCFDQPNCFQAYIQSKGRVRSENGLFYVLADEFNDNEKDYNNLFYQFVEIEKIFTKLVPLMNELRFEAKQGRKSLKFDVASIKTEPSDSSAAAVTAASTATCGPSPNTVQLTMENAISILNRYCLKLPSDTFTKLAPHYYIDPVTIPQDGVQLNGAARYQCRLYLPINSTFRDEVKGDPVSNRVMAKRSAAFKAVKILQEMGELDANYYPIGKETSRYIEKLGLQDCFITTARTTEGAVAAASTTTNVTAATTSTGPGHNRPGNRYNRLQARNIASKRRLYYDKKVANYLSSGKPFTEVTLGSEKRYRLGALYEFTMALTCPLPEEQNVRGRPLVDPAKTRRNFGIIVPGTLPSICDFTIYNRSGEVTVSLKKIEASSSSRIYSEAEISSLKTFHTFTIEGVLRLGKNQLKATFDGDASNGNFLIVPVNDTLKEGARDIDWDFIQQIVKHVDDLEATKTATEVVGAIPAVLNTITSTDPFVFVAEKYRDAVVIPTYRRDKAQAFFYVAQICEELSPMSSFPDHGFATFEEYYRLKYGLVITNTKQPLLDVDHTSSRLNLLTPRYLNRKGGNSPDSMLFTSSSSSKKVNEKAAKKSSNLQQKQILVPELCAIHPFPASFWRKAVTLPCMLYRLNSLLVAEELRQTIAREANIGLLDLPDGMRWPALDFGWSRVVQSHCAAVKAKAEEEERKAEAEAKAKLNTPMISFDGDNELSPEYACPTRDDEGINMAGRPSKKAIVPGSLKKGSVEVGDFNVDIFQAPPPSSQLPEPLKPISTSPVPSVSPITNGLRPKASKTSFQPVPDDELDADPFSKMGDWNSFAAQVSATQPELFKPPTTEIEIISFGTSSDPSTAIPDDFGDKDPELIALREQAEAKAKEKARLAAMASGLTAEVNIDEPAIIEVDEDGNPLERPMRIGSPTQFVDQRLSDDEEEEEESEDGAFKDIYAVDITTDWTVPCDGASVHSEDDMTNEMNKFTLNLDGLSKDLENLQVCEDDDFLAEIANSYGNPNEDDKDGCSLKSSDEVKEVSDDLDGSYSDFDVDDMDDEDEYFPELAEDLDLEDLDDDEELVFDNDDDDEGYSEGAKSGIKKSKKKQKKKKGGNAAGGDLSTVDGEDANAENDETGVKAKSFIYDILRYELLYDCQTFEKQSKTPQMFGGDGSQLLNVDRQNRSRNRKIYERIYLAERTEVAMAAEKVMQELNMDVIEDVRITGYWSPEDHVEMVDRKLDDVVITGEERFHELVTCKFDEDSLCPFKPPPDPLDEMEKLNDDELKEDPRALMADYGLDGTGTDEVKFGELLPNRTANDGDDNKQPQFSFDANPTNPKAPTGGLCLGPDPSLILQAITMSNSSDGINLERLETVGDSFLKYSITAFLFCMCPDLNEGKLSFLRSRQISNINLHRLGQRIQLGQLMIASKFEPNDNWCPPGYKVLEETETNGSPQVDKNKVPYNLLTQHSIPNKSIADCVEALIGTYLISSGSQGAIQFMDWLGLKVMPKEFKALTRVADTVSAFSANARDQWLPLPKSPLITPKDSVGTEGTSTTTPELPLREKLQSIYQQHRLDHFEQAIGYTFKDKAYLVQAFTHNSYYENTVTDCYQRLEFLGDAVLDYLITRYLYEDPRCHSPGTLTDLRSALVNNTFFASLAVKYSFNKYLMMLSHELFRVVDGFVRKFNLCNANRVEEQKARESAAAAQGEDAQEEEEDPSKRSCVYWELFISENEAEHLEDIEVPKALGDIFESVAGAIFLDSGMSLDAVWNAYYPMMKPEIEYFSYNVPKSPIRVLLEKQPQSAKFGKPEITSGRKIRVSVEVFNVGKFVGVGRNKRIAKCTAAKRALRALKIIEDLQRKRAEELMGPNRSYVPDEDLFVEESGFKITEEPLPK